MLQVMYESKFEVGLRSWCSKDKWVCHVLILSQSACAQHDIGVCGLISGGGVNICLL